MHHGTKKLFLALIGIIAITALIFVFQFKKSSAITTKNTPEPLLSSFAIDIPVSSTDPMLGNPGAPLTLVGFFDLGNKESRALYATLTDFVKQHPQDARLIWKDLPEESILFGANNLPHQAAWCAHTAKRFWPFADAVMAGRNTNKEPELRKIAGTIGLEVEGWWGCAQDPKTVERVTQASALAARLGIRETPALYINNKKLNLNVDIDLPQMLSSFIAK